MRPSGTACSVQSPPDGVKKNVERPMTILLPQKVLIRKEICNNVFSSVSFAIILLDLF